MEDRKKLLSPLFVLGFPRCATSTIATALNNHPDVLFPIDKKSTSFYSSSEFDLGEEYLFDRYYPIINDELYFADGNPVNGVLPLTASRIFGLYPNAKLIFSIRNPIERAYSNWFHNVETGFENRSFESVIDEEINRGSSYRDYTENYWLSYRERALAGKESWRKNERHYLFFGYYAYHLKNFLSYFPSEQIHIINYKSLKHDYEGELAKLFDFLNLEVTFTHSRIVHKNFAVKNEEFLRFSSIIKRTGVLNVLPMHSKARLKAMVNFVLRSSDMNKATAALIRDYYSEKEIELKSLLQEKF